MGAKINKYDNPNLKSQKQWLIKLRKLLRYEILKIGRDEQYYKNDSIIEIQFRK